MDLCKLNEHGKLIIVVQDLRIRSATVLASACSRPLYGNLVQYHCIVRPSSDASSFARLEFAQKRLGDEETTATWSPDHNIR